MHTEAVERCTTNFPLMKVWSLRCKSIRAIWWSKYESWNQFGDNGKIKQTVSEFKGLLVTNEWVCIGKELKESDMRSHIELMLAGFLEANEFDGLGDSLFSMHVSNR